MQQSSSQQPSEVGIHPPSYRLPASARVGKVRLAVSNLEASLAFYSAVIGLSVIRLDSSPLHSAYLGTPAGIILLELEEQPGCQPIHRRSRLGLYHTAILLPSRTHLSSFVDHLNRSHISFGAGDHIYSEALYLTDPDGLTVEVYADRDQKDWIYEGNEIVSATNSVRFETLPIVAPGSWQGVPNGTRIGHVHFYVEDLKAAEGFYHRALGLDIVTWRYPGALFTSAGGYHHHVGLNIWAAGSPPASPQESRILFWELVLPSQAEVNLVAQSLEHSGFTRLSGQQDDPTYQDPWGIPVKLTVA